MKRYCFLAALSGCAWAVIAVALSFGVFGVLVVGGLAASPLIGLFIGLVSLPAHKFPRWAQGMFSLGTLYIAVAMFGLAVGINDAARAIPNRASDAVILQTVIASTWGITMTGYVVVLWPLAFLNHRLLWKGLTFHPSKHL